MKKKYKQLEADQNTMNDKRVEVLKAKQDLELLRAMLPVSYVGIFPEEEGSSSTVEISISLSENQGLSNQ